MSRSQFRSRNSISILNYATTTLGFLILYLPLLSLVFYSFLTQSSGVGAPREWTLQWYVKLFANPMILDALRVSLWIGFWSTLGATLLGTMAAFTLARYSFPGRRLFDVFSHLPLIMPEIVLGIALLTWFVALHITLGQFSVILAHITFSMSYVMITVKARLQGFDHALEDAAKDLGASSWLTFWRVTFPLIWPGIFSGALMAFTLSFDDFLITYFTTGVGSDTLPLKIYSMIKFGVTPEIHALSTLMLLITLVMVLLFKPKSDT